MKELHKNKKSFYCQYLKEGADVSAPLCRLRQLKPVLSMYELGLYCKSKNLNTCPYLEHLSKLVSKDIEGLAK